MAYYPIFVELQDIPCVVIGGGREAQRKAEGLLGAGAKVTGVSPDLTQAVSTMLANGEIEHIARDYQEGDIDPFHIVMVATDDGKVNGEVSAEGRRKRIWVNAADDIPNCDFTMPGIAQRGDLIVAVSTSAGSPAMARKMREELEAFLTEEHVLMLELAAEVRRELHDREVKVDPDTWNAALDADLKRLLGEGRRDEAKQRLLRSLLEPAGER